MFRNYLIILVLSFGLIFQGCAAIDYFRDRSENKIKNVDLQRQINILGKETEGIKDKNRYAMIKIKEQNKQLTQQISKLREENQKIIDEYKFFLRKSTGLQQKPGPPSYESYTSERDIRKQQISASHKLRKDIQRIKIKVLSGNGEINSAKKITKKLNTMGYQITSIGFAPRSNFDRDTIYFAPTYINEAKQLAPALGSKTILKLLNWSSIFNLIVVTGKNP